MKTYFDIQKKKLEIEERYAKAKADELKLARISKEVEIMTMDLSKVSEEKEFGSSKSKRRSSRLMDELWRRYKFFMPA